MGKTAHKYRDDEDDQGRKKTRAAKHSRNIPGKGMRVINSWCGDEDDDEYFDDDIEMEDAINIVHNKTTL